MGRHFVSWCQRFVSLTLVVSLTVLLPIASIAQKSADTDGIEKDNPLQRMKSQEEQHGKVTPAYRTKVLNEAQKHNQRLGRNTSGIPLGTPGQPEFGPTWINIGPFGQEFGQNGSYTGDGVDSGRLRTILVHPTDPNVVYILSSAGGLWKTTNFQDAVPNWKPLTDFLPTTAGGAAAFGSTADVIYLGLGDPFDQITVGGSIVKSADGGESWSPMITLGNTISVRDVKVDTSGPTDIVLVATDGGLWRSTDAGATYGQVTGTAFQDQYIWSLAKTNAGWLMATQETQAQTNGTCTIGYRWCTGRGHLYLSTDKGATWTEQTNGLGVFGRTTLGVGVDGDAVVYAFAAVQYNGSFGAALDSKDLYRSADGGKTWIALGVNSTKAPINPQPSYATTMNVMNGQAFYNQTILVDPTDPTRNTVFLGGTYYVTRTNDGGATWKILSEWLPGWAVRNGKPALPYVHADMHAMAYKATGNPVVLLGTDGGLTVSPDSGESWDTSKNTNLVTHMFYSIIGNALFPNFAMGGLQDNGTRVRVGNTGVFNQSLGGDGFGVGMSQANAETAIQSVYYNSLRRWRTRVPAENITESAASLAGQSSSISPFNTPVISPPASADPSGLIFFSQGLTRLYKTINGGVSWTAFSTIGSTAGLSGVSFRDSPFAMSVSPANINHLAVGTNGGRVYVSLDGGTSWTYNLGTDNPAGWPGFVNSVSWADANTIWVSSSSQSEGLYTGVPTVRVVKSTDKGATWAAAGNGLPDVPVTRVIGDPRDVNTAYAATHIGVYRTTDGGANWSAYGAGLPNVRVNDLYMPPDGGYLRIATYGRGLWQLSNLDYMGAELVDDGGSCELNGNLGNNETGHLNVTFGNPSAFPVEGGLVKVTSDNPHLQFIAGNDVTIGTVAANGTVTVPLAVRVQGATGVETANLSISYGDSAMVTITRPIAINYDDNANASASVDWESKKSGWTVESGTSAKPGINFVWTLREFTPLQHIYAVTDANDTQDTSLVSPVLKVGTGAFGFSFTHRHVFETGYDGGVVEISTNDGASWTPITGTFTTGGYTHTLAAGGPAGAVQAWSGTSTGWPNTTTVAVDLGTAYASQDVRIRFRALADVNTGAQGWEVSNIAFTGLTNTPFGAIVAHNEVCASTVSLTSSPNPSNNPDEVTFTATVSGGVTPATGTVTLKEGATVIGSAAAVDGVATIKTSTLSVGTHYVVASFAGDAGHGPADSAQHKHTVLAVARTTFTPVSLDFGDARVGTSSGAQTAVLKNTGTAPLVINSIVANGDFAQTNNCSTTIAAGGSCTITVRFTPAGAIGARTGAVTVTSNGVGGGESLALTGNATAAKAKLDKASLSYANTLVGSTTATQTVTITNDGNIDLAIASVEAAGDFTQTNDCTESAIAPGASCSVQVAFAPTAVGNRTGTITITDDGTDSPQSITLSGKADNLHISGTTTQSVSVKNTAAFPLTLHASTALSGVVNLTCSGAPALTSCSFTTAAPTLVAGGTAAVTVNVAPAPKTASAAQPGQVLFATFGILGIALLPFARKANGRKAITFAAIVLVMTISVGGMVACGGGNDTPPPPKPTPTTTYATPGTYTLTVTATSGSTTLQTQTLTLTLQ